MILELNNITFGYSADKQILNNISLSLEEQNVYALIGSNGAGKTTLFNIISGFLKPQNGEIFFSETNILNKQPYKINRLGIGRTFQDLRLITKLTVKENIILSMQNNSTDNVFNAMLPENFYRSEIQKLDTQANELIERYFLSDICNSLASDISYGQQKLLCLACCVANSASLILLDEPVAGIQPEYRNKIAELIKRLKEKGKTILLIEHNTDFICDIDAKVIFLNKGEISLYENIDTFRKDKLVMEAYY